MIITALLFIIGLALLVKGADYFVDGGGGLATRYGVSPTTIGFTVIAFGTSLPEWVVSINAIIINKPDIALGNVVGSNIANIALVLGLCAALKPAVVGHNRESGKALYHETALMIAATLIFVLLSLRGTIDLVAGIILLVSFILILRSLWKTGKTDGEPIKSHGQKDWILTIGGLIAVIAGAQLLLDSAVTLAEFLGIPAFVIGLTIVAVGTSLPELVTSVVAILKGNAGISVGNILGSNIFNILFVLGSGALIRPVPIPGLFDIGVMALLSLATVPLFAATDRFTRYWAVLLLLGYGTYMVWLFGILA
ncbi:MAG: calcium/sodium antiporter [Methanomicrobiaceae archaeon]|nr:calcium/sodium antiporter [Methanomicrobiaceae archaeon]